MRLFGLILRILLTEYLRSGILAGGMVPLGRTYFFLPKRSNMPSILTKKEEKEEERQKSETIFKQLNVNHEHKVASQ